jgi:Tol biopolymer transport system component
MTKLISAIVLAAALLAVSAAPAVQAAFPGPNGRILYEDSLSSGFYTVNPDGGGRAQILAGEGTRTDDPRYSPDGRLVAYSRSLDLWVVDAGGGTPRQVTAGDNNDQGAAFSPDGTKLVFRRVANDDLYVVNLDGTGLRNLTADGGTSQEYEPAWSPDGTKIAYELGTSSGQGSIFSIDADGGNPTNLTPENPTPPTCDPDHFRRSRDPSWSPDGSRIAFTGSPVCNGTTSQIGTDIWLMNPDGGGKVNIVANDGISEEEPHWSPDGSRIAFISDQEENEGPGDIFQMAPNGSGRVKVIDRETKGEDIDWGQVTPPLAIHTPTALAPSGIDTPPSLGLKFGTRSLGEVLRRGLPITVRTDENARMTVQLQLPRELARGLGIASAAWPVTVGRLTRNVERGRSKVRVKLSEKPARRLRQHRKLQRLTLNVRTTLKDRAGLTTTKTVRVKLKR